jgi:hypothetical protein
MQERLNKMEAVLKQEEVTIGLLDAQAKGMVEKAKDLYADTEARANATIKQHEDLNGQMISLAQQERMVAAREQELWEKEEEVTDMLECGRSDLSSREADLDTHETALAADRKSLGDLSADVLARELSTKLKVSQLAFREKELADKEKRLAETQPQELVATHKSLEELQTAQAGEA